MVKTAKAKTEAPIDWEAIELWLSEVRKGGMVTQVHTTADNAPDFALDPKCNAKVFKADKNYAVYSTGEIVDL
jgi:hypothetical protein